MTLHGLWRPTQNLSDCPERFLRERKTFPPQTFRTNSGASCRCVAMAGSRNLLPIPSHPSLCYLTSEMALNMGR